jgi:hypothetical protein
VAREGSLDLLERLKSIEPRFAAVPHVNFVANRPRGRRRKPVPLPHLNVAAQPLEGLDYLIEKTTKAAVVGASGILVNVPLPARFALHKLWVAKNRSVSEQTKARKDIAQAQQIIEVLLADRPDDIDRAVSAMKSRPKMWKRVAKELDRVVAAP